MIDATEKTTAIRVATLARISGLTVECYMRSGTRYFVFGPKDQPIKTVCTYRKARAFAEGVAISQIRKPTKPSQPLQVALTLVGGAILFAAGLVGLFAPQFATPLTFAALAVVVAVMIFGEKS
jgi:hypothetical protein